MTKYLLVGINNNLSTLYNHPSLAASTAINAILDTSYAINVFLATSYAINAILLYFYCNQCNSCYFYCNQWVQPNLCSSFLASCFSFSRKLLFLPAKKLKHISRLISSFSEHFFQVYELWLMKREDILKNTVTCSVHCKPHVYLQGNN